MTRAHEPDWRLRTVLGLLGVLLLLTGLVGLAAPQATPTPTQNLSEKAPYYANNTSSVNNDTWLAGNEEPTLDNVTHLLTRVGTFIVGDSSMQGAPGSAGPLVMGLLLFGTVAGGAVGGRVGAIGGAVMGVATLSALVGAALAPHWIWAVTLAVIGLLATVVVIRALR